MAAESLFWICLILVAYTYFLYPLLLFVAYAFSQVSRDWQYLTSRCERRVRALASAELPTVSLIVPAYNEEVRLPKKIENLSQLDYPPDKLEVIFVSDGSTDRTNEILQALKEPNIKKILLPSRQGKSNGLNEAVVRAEHDILLFSDSSTLIAGDAIRKLVRHFADPRVGAVCGWLRFEGTEESRQTEGVYWKYECILRLMEARLGVTLTASGAIYASRRECYLPLETETVIDDFIMPMNARKLGYRVLYDPEAVATEFAASSVSGEFTRRVRLAAGSFRALPELIRTATRGPTALAFFSHKLLRWLVPFLLIGLLVSNAFLLGDLGYRLSFIGQLCFYLWAVLGAVLRRQIRGIRYALVGYFLLAMNLAFLVGFFRWLWGRADATWQRVD